MDAPQAGSLRESVAGGIAWKLLTQVVVQASRVVVGVILARILSPTDFGIAGMALIVSGFLAIFTDLSLGAALVQRSKLTEEDISTVFWTTIGVALVFAVVGAASAGQVAAFFGHPSVGPLFAALAAGFVLNAAAATQSALLTRAMAFRALQVREMAATVGGAVVGVGIAVAGGGAWAIVAQPLTASAVSLVLVWRASSWRPRRVYSTASLRTTAGYGSKLFAAQILSYFTLNGDNFLIAKFIGSAALGTYTVAYNLMFTPMLRLAQPIHQVAFPAYARLSAGGADVVPAWLRGKRLSALVLAPASIGLLVTAPDLIPTVVGSKWDKAVPVVEVLCLAGVTQAVGTLNWTILMALGRAGTYLRLNILETAVTVAAFAIGLPWGIVGVAAAYAISKWPLTLIDTYYASKAIGARTVDALAAAALPAFVAASAMGAAAYAVRRGLEAGGVPASLRLLLVIAFSIAAYGALLRVFFARDYRELRSLLPGRR